VRAGCGRAVAGGVFQALFGNPLASPYTLGVSNGAGFGAALAIVLTTSAAAVQISALAFGIVSVGLTFLLAGRKRSAPVTMILSGMLVSAFFSSLVALLKFTADPQEKLPQIVYWLMGSLASVRYDGLLLVLPAYIAALVLLLLYRWRINILSMGTQEARSMGVSVTRDRALIILAATLLTSLVVSFSGIIGWVGIVIPHLARMITGPDFRRLMPVSAALGVVYLLVIDDLCRTLTSLEIPIGVITGIVSIPIFIYFILKKKVRWS
jgi:transport system permease protein